MKRPVDKVIEDLEKTEQKARDIQKMFVGAGWEHLKRYLEMRYLELNFKDCDSMKALIDRNGRMSEIRMLFSCLRHEFNERERLLQDLQVFQKDEDELPSPQIFS